ncbi:CRISPR-associated endonuclease Cas2 [Campylobacter sp. CCUG 57310]|uniref:CRISPR-associated endonuclease Cas2 n=1 Tax=Campylobacter sp. CCUG 57310 TaxID=2517362 RepID=UPI0015637AA2|nr:CRISPR-associated endonuclease Cas2 [Campylobacter sp. CCUG 57310]QKF92731.1 CRISPR/Cas system-associated endoribonuclease Cas2, type III-B [Campylobacter sp. CCUG 57310]
MNLIICYDIRSTKRRNKVSNLLESYGLRANYSVFELDIKESDYYLIKSKIAKLIEPKSDKVLFYRVCKTCLAKSESMGEGKIFNPLDTYI